MRIRLEESGGFASIPALDTSCTAESMVTSTDSPGPRARSRTTISRTWRVRRRHTGTRPSTYMAADASQHVVYRSADGHVHELTWGLSDPSLPPVRLQDGDE